MIYLNLEGCYGVSQCFEAVTDTETVSDCELLCGTNRMQLFIV